MDFRLTSLRTAPGLGRNLEYTYVFRSGRITVLVGYTLDADGRTHGAQARVTNLDGAGPDRADVAFAHGLGSTFADTLRYTGRLSFPNGLRRALAAVGVEIA